MSAYTIDLLVMGSLTLIFLMTSFFKKNVCKNLAFIRIIFVKEVNITKSLYCVCLVKFFSLFSECYTFKLQRHARDYHFN